MNQPPMDSLDRWLARRRLLVVIALVVLAVTVRLVCFVQLLEGPCLQLHACEATDMHTFDTWARDIAAGDWLSRTIRYPLHGWHRLLATAHFRDHPEDPILADTQAGQGGEDERASRLWDRWCGGGRFYQAPLYPYLIALTHRSLGTDVRWVFAWQMILGVLSILLLQAIGRQLFSETTGVVAAAFGILCGPLLFYELTLLRVTLVVFAGLALVYLLLGATARPRLRSWFVVGVALGLCLWLRASFLLVAIGVGGLLVRQYWGQWRRLRSLAGIMLLGLLLGFGPVVVRNLALNVSPFQVASAGGFNFIVCNAEDARSSASFQGWRHVAGIMHATDGQLLPAAVATIRTHDSAGSYAGLLTRKLAAICHWFEMPNNASFYFFQLHAVVLRYLPISFLIMAPLGLMGLILAARSGRRAAPLFILIAAHAAVMVFFFVYARFRAPLLVALIPFAAWTVVRLVHWSRARRLRPVLVTIVGLVIILAWTARPLPAGHSPIRVADYAAVYQAHYDPQARDAETAGRWERAVELWVEFLRLEPDTIRDLRAGDPVPGRELVPLMRLFGTAMERCALALENCGRTAESARLQSRARVLYELQRAARKGRSGDGQP